MDRAAYHVTKVVARTHARLHACLRVELADEEPRMVWPSNLQCASFLTYTHIHHHFITHFYTHHLMAQVAS